MKESEPKTKRMAVLAFIDVFEDILNDTNLTYSIGWDLPGGAGGGFIAEVELFDPARFRYGVPKKGDLCLVNLNKPSLSPELCSQTFDWESENREQPIRLIIDPPTQPETVDDVLKRRPKTDNYSTDSGPLNKRYFDDMRQWEEDLKAAQEREG